ncbi:MAG TPA: cobalamin biosynthesis protein [Acidimicrobiales bacterium]|nr:cobalamin biosynthesis protein [Acidimicrobiales bacterium]
MTDVVVGLGLTRDASIDDVRAAIDDALSEIDCGWSDVVRLATTVRRRGHPAIDAVTADGTIPLSLFEPSDLARVTVPNPSAAVGARAGTTSVAEAAALMAANAEILLLPKQTGKGVTVALAEHALPHPSAALRAGSRGPG